MPKKYAIYTVPFDVVVNTIPVPPPGNASSNELTKGTLYIGVRLETNLIDQRNLYQQLGLVKREAIPEDLNGVSVIQLSSFGEAASIGAFSSATLTLCPLDPADVDPSFGPLYNTYICYSAKLSLREAAEIIYPAPFMAPAGKSLYRVVPGSIKERRSRKFRPIAV